MSDKGTINLKTPAKLNPKLEEILLLIYRFRFLTTSQIQILLNHKYHSRINLWLNQLTTKKYLKRYYDLKFAGEPALYSLGTAGRKYFKTHQEIKGIKASLLDRVWTEYRNSLQFKRHCLLLADIYISLLGLTSKAKAKLGFYSKVDLFGMKFMVLPEPSGYFSLEDQNGVTKRYFLDIFDYFVPKDLFRRIKKYLYYFEKRYWQDHTDKPFPEIILVCPNKAARTYLEKTIKGNLEDKDFSLSFYLGLQEEIKAKGLIPETLHKVQLYSN